MKKSILILAIPLSVLALPNSVRTARAEDVVVQRPDVVKDQTSTTGPNQTLLHSGVWILGLSYVPVVIVAAESSRAGDKNLYIPVAGPWLDLATRQGCQPGVSCNETANKLLIVIDGIFQGMGALDIVGSFIFPETHTVTVSSSERCESPAPSFSIRIAPAKVSARAYGMAAVGTF
jgi:hypothetical protein